MFLVLWENMISWAGFVLSGLKDMFNLYAKSYILIRLLLSLDVDSLTLATAENCGVLSTNNLTSVC